MARLILIIASALMLGSIVVGFMNRSSFITLRAEKDDANKAINSTLDQTSEVISELEDVQKSVNTTEDERDVARVGTEEANRKVDSTTAQINQREQEIKGKENRIAEIEKALEPFKGITLETLNDTLDEMKKEVADLEEEIATSEKELEVTTAKVNANQATIDDYANKQAERSRKIALDSIEGTITAVNNDWGFVVINVGRNRGLDPDAALLIKRGNENIGKLSVRSIEPNMVVADIMTESLKQGARVMPGDRVVFKTGVN